MLPHRLRVGKKYGTQNIDALLLKIKRTKVGLYIFKDTENTCLRVIKCNAVLAEEAFEKNTEEFVGLFDHKAVLSDIAQVLREELEELLR